MAKDGTTTGKKILLVQDHQVRTLHDHLGILEEHATDLRNNATDRSEALSDLDARMSDLFAAVGMARPGDRELGNVEIADHLLLSESEVVAIQQQLPDLSLGIAVPDGEVGWTSYLKEVDRYVLDNGIDLDRDPLEQLLPPHRAAEIYHQFGEDYGDSPWDKWDYGAVALSVLVGVLLDYFIVATPVGGKFRGEPQRGSPLTRWMRDKSNSPGLNGLTEWAEKHAKVPYDRVRPRDGRTPNAHRLSSLGHDPLFGLVFGVIDVLRDTCTFVDKTGGLQIDKMVTERITGDSIVEIPEAIVKVVLHYLSDVFTERGLPAPFLAQLQFLQAPSGLTLRENGNIVSINELVRYMYTNGYDFRHFLTMAIVPAVAEMIIRIYHAMRTRSGEGELGKEGVRGKIKLSKMLILTHLLLSGGNILKTALYNWNPTALNFAQFAALALRMVSLLKLCGEREDLIARQLEDGWKELLYAELPD